MSLVIECRQTPSRTESRSDAHYLDRDAHTEVLLPILVLRVHHHAPHVVFDGDWHAVQHGEVQCGVSHNEAALAAALVSATRWTNKI